MRFGIQVPSVILHCPHASGHPMSPPVTGSSHYFSPLLPKTSQLEGTLAVSLPPDLPKSLPTFPLALTSSVYPKEEPDSPPVVSPLPKIKHQPGSSSNASSSFYLKEEIDISLADILP